MIIDVLGPKKSRNSKMNTCISLLPTEEKQILDVSLKLATLAKFTSLKSGSGVEAKINMGLLTGSAHDQL